MIKYFCILLTSLFLLNSIDLKAQPNGIYVLDNNKGTYRDANIRNYTFVDGFVWRTSWSEIETSKDSYDFAALDHIVKRLDSIDKKLTILFGAYAVEPPYIAMQPGVANYPFTDPLSSITTTRAVPYDSYLIQRFRLFLSIIANHSVYSLSLGKLVALKDHPVLANIATNIPGLGAIRNVNGTSTNIQSILPGYNRYKFVDSLVLSMQIQTDYFPDKNVFVPFYKNINDSINSPSLATYLRTKLLQHFDNVLHSKISFWQENLAGYTDTFSGVFTGLPLTTFATPLYQLKDSAYTMFQMLQGWTTPFLDPAKTANSSPFDAMCYAYKTYGTTYFEIYAGDIDDTIYQKKFNAWNPISTCIESAIINHTESEINNFSAYPNPVNNRVFFTGFPKALQYEIVILDILGRQLVNISNDDNVDVSMLKSGVYLVKLKDSKGNHYLRFAKQ
jgi:hypothetical protein